MKRIVWAMLAILALALASRPAAREQAKNAIGIALELFGEARESLVQAPIDQAKDRYLQEAKKTAMEEAEARQKQLDTEIDRQTLHQDN